MTSQLNRLSLVFVAAFAAVAMVGGYWSFVQRDVLVSRADNPRRLLDERRTPRGLIYDRDGAILAESVGEAGTLERHYPYPRLAPVLGYVSPLYGTAGVEAGADPVLHGDAGYSALELYWQDDLFGSPPPGRGVRLTIDLDLQRAADDALGERIGAVVLVHSETGEILALASHPTYDANRLDALWEDLLADERSPLVNRATFALYQPGGALWPVVLAGAFQAGYGDLSLPFPFAANPVEIAGQTIACRTPPAKEQITLTETLQLGCPWPIATLGNRLGSQNLEELFDDFGLYAAPDLGIPAVAAPREALGDARLAAIGQGTLTVTPLHLALVTAAFAEGGAIPTPVLIAAVEGRDGTWQPQASDTPPAAAVAPQYADTVKALIVNGYSAPALTGAEGETLAWFTGFEPAGDAKYAVAVLLEDGDLAAAGEIGRAVLEAAIAITGE